MLGLFTPADRDATAALFVHGGVPHALEGLGVLGLAAMDVDHDGSVPVDVGAESCRAPGGVPGGDGLVCGEPERVEVSGYLIGRRITDRNGEHQAGEASCRPAGQCAGRQIEQQGLFTDDDGGHGDAKDRPQEV